MASRKSHQNGEPESGAEERRTAHAAARNGAVALADAPTQRRGRVAGGRGNGEGSIDEWKPGKWRARLTVHGKPMVRYAKSRPAAVKELAALRRMAEERTVPTSGQMRVSDLFDRWLAECKARGRKPRTLWAYETFRRLYIDPALGKVKLADLKPAHVQQLRDDMLERRLSPTTVRNTRTVLHSALELAVHLGLIAQNVAKRVKPPARRRPQLRWPKPEEMRLLVDRAKAQAAADAQSERQRERDQAHLWAALWATAAYSGCRPGEMLGLGWDDVDFQTNRLTIRRALVKLPKQAAFLAEPKTENARRTITMPAEAMALLRQHRAEQNALKLRLGAEYGGEWREADLVFASVTGAPLLPRNVDTHFKEALAAADLPETIRFYDMRHGNATLMLKARVQPKVAASRLGHATTQLFNDTYSHMLDDMDADVATRVELVMAGAS